MKDFDRRGKFSHCQGLSRLDFIGAGSATTAAVAMPVLLLPRTRAIHPAEKRLSFYNLHTGERLNAVYWGEGRYVPDSLKEVNWVPRDYRRNKAKPIDLRLLDLLYALDRKLETRQPFQIPCGYRSPAASESLQEHTAGVAKHSMHLQAKAIDIRIPGCNLAAPHRAALTLDDGSGSYPISDFVHVDAGRVRYRSFPAVARQSTTS
jgi:uncharacterized protein YcbK (DUF882 family)